MTFDEKASLGALYRLIHTQQDFWKPFRLLMPSKCIKAMVDPSKANLPISKRYPFPHFIASEEGELRHFAFKAVKLKLGSWQPTFSFQSPGNCFNSSNSMEAIRWPPLPVRIHALNQARYHQHSRAINKIQNITSFQAENSTQFFNRNIF